MSKTTSLQNWTWTAYLITLELLRQLCDIAAFIHNVQGSIDYDTGSVKARSRQMFDLFYGSEKHLSIQEYL